MGPCCAESDLHPIPRPRIAFNVGIMLSVKVKIVINKA